MFLCDDRNDLVERNIDGWVIVFEKIILFYFGFIGFIVGVFLMDN